MKTLLILIVTVFGYNGQEPQVSPTTLQLFKTEAACLAAAREMEGTVVPFRNSQGRVFIIARCVAGLQQY